LALVVLAALATPSKEPLDQILFLVRLHQLAVAAAALTQIRLELAAALVAVAQEMLPLQRAGLELQAKGMRALATLVRQIIMAAAAAVLGRFQLTPAMATAVTAFHRR
jgi:hypothetical protein